MRDALASLGVASKLQGGAATPGPLHHEAIEDVETEHPRMRRTRRRSSRKRESNPRPAAYEAAALPLSYFGVARAGFEPATSGLWAQRAAKLPYRASGLEGGRTPDILGVNEALYR